MKKNITINLFGNLYNIDEDAYELLYNYLESVKKHFAGKGENDVADDIEHRVAELLWEYREAGNKAVDISTIRGIIDKIGSPDLMDINFDEEKFNNEKSAQSEGDPKQNRPVEKRFFRDPNNEVLGGVCSGFTYYVGSGDIWLWRLLFIVAGLFIPMVLIYIVLWIILPKAQTPEDRLRMKGRAITPEGIAWEENEITEGLSHRHSPIFKILVIILLAIIFLLIIRFTIFLPFRIFHWVTPF